MVIEEADYVIAGGGSAGCALAARLSEDPRDLVVLLEAGPDSDRLLVTIPAGMRRIVRDRELNWLYFTEPDTSAGDRPVVWQSGRMLGGGSALNGMVYMRGARHDYDDWASKGCAGWSWEDVLPYFQKAESYEGDGPQSFGRDGPLSVAQLRVVHPLAHDFVRACTEIGLRELRDYCSGDLDGAYINLATQRKGLRCSTARAYLRPALRRRNFRALTGALVDRVMFSGTRACGIRYWQDGVQRELRVRREVIVSAGTVQSPAILMRSGIGPGAHLQEHGIAVVSDSASVGKNLHDHPSLAMSRLVRQPTYNVPFGLIRKARECLDFTLRRRGVLTTCAVHAQAHGRTSPDLERPDIKLQFLPFWGAPMHAASLCPDAQTCFGVSITVNIMNPKSRGEVKLRSSNPHDKPVINYRIYDDSYDIEHMRRAMRFTDRIFDAAPLARHTIGPAYPQEPKQSDADWEDQLRRFSHVGSHPVGTCRMGANHASVIDPQLRVRNLEGLRVIDGSVMPVLPSANTNGPIVMIAEKGADLLRSAL